MKRLLILTFTITVAFALLIAAVRHWGTLNPSPAAALGIETCSQGLCWHGIQPEETTLEQFSAIMNADKQYIFYANAVQWDSACWSSDSSQVQLACTYYINKGSANFMVRKISNLSLAFPKANLKLGDVVTLLGEPLASAGCFQPGGINQIFVQFKGNVNAWASQQSGGSKALSPDAYIARIDFGVSVMVSDQQTWKGFSRLKTCFP